MIASAAISSMHMMVRWPIRFTRHRSFFVVRVREGAPQSPFALVSTRPHPKAAAQDRSDTVARRRAPLPWRACAGTRQVICEWLRAVRRSWASRLGRKLLIPRQLASRAGPLLTCAVQAGNASTARPTSRGDRVLRRARARWVSLIMAGLLARKRTVRSAYWGHVRIQSSHL
jgi:hypothetical protein